MRHSIKPFLLCSALIASLTAFGQNWNTDSLRWNVLDNFGGNTEHYLGENVLINDTMYRSIYAGTCGSSQWPASMTGHIRQVDQLIYIRPLMYHKEFLLYDFSLEQGDSMYIQLCTFGDIYMVDELGLLEVQAVDSVSTLSGWRKRIRFVEFDWIEGLGSTRGPIDYTLDYCAFDIYFTLLCAKEGDSLLYQNAAFPTCCLSTLLVNEDAQNTTLFAAPNPVDAGAAVQLLGASSFAEATLYDSAGRLLNRWTWQQGHPFNPSASGLGAGMYILHLSDGREHVVQKLILR